MFGGRSRRGLAHLAIAATAAACGAIAACGQREASHPLDAAAADAEPIDAAIVVDAAVKPPPVPIKLVASGDSTCAVMSDHTLRCWGANAHGQLGDGTAADSAVPTAPAIHAVKDVQLADATACALLDDGSVACWGQINWNGHADDVLRPTGVLGVIGVTQIFVRSRRACARLANGELICWGNVDARGHFVGGADAKPTFRVPTPVVGIDHVAGLVDSGAFADDGRMWRWGNDGAPVVLDAEGVEEIAERDGELCGRLSTGRVVCASSDRCGTRHADSPKVASGKAAGSSKVASSGAAGSSKAASSGAAGSLKAAGSSKTASSGTATSSKSASAGVAGSSKAASSGAAGSSKTASSVTAGSSKTASSGTAGSSKAAASGAAGSSKAGSSGALADAAKSSTASAKPTGEPVDTLGFTDVHQLAFEIGFCAVTNNKLQCSDGCRRLEPATQQRIASTVGRCVQFRSGAISCFRGPKATTASSLSGGKLLAAGRATHASSSTITSPVGATTVTTNSASYPTCADYPAVGRRHLPPAHAA